ncbi:PorH family porin [Corynebacterium lubricantis]|uniref:PorH family porin n=1 Tax=Corynebacterium lubricantis TaxID=541095 RepID=UPI000381C4C1|nr:PorH family porin [Corynebacterium lubricantis]
MDLSLIGDLLGDFATFGKNIGEFLQAPAVILQSLSSFVDGGAEAGIDVTSSILDGSSLSSGSSE